MGRSVPSLRTGSVADLWIAQLAELHHRFDMPDSADSSARSHWNAVYESKAPTQVSWYQAHPERSLELLAQLGVDASSAIIDVGGGASTLVDALLDRGFTNITVLDISRAALAHAAARLGPRDASVRWIEADITTAELQGGAYDVWHDRAVFHFLTASEDRRAYVAAAERAIRPGGAAVVATFSLQGPTRCSGLEIVRYDAELLAREFGSEFTLERSVEDVHHTPAGVSQAFTYVVLRRE
jgi:2-polyprenyl-3-methyl-5-hydroxy-6-metoxy-1,4-benzoquinol methylase